MMGHHAQCTLRGYGYEKLERQIGSAQRIQFFIFIDSDLKTDHIFGSLFNLLTDHHVVHRC